MDEEILISLIKEKNIKELRPILEAMNSVDIAHLLVNISKEDLPIIFRLLPKDIAADTFVEMDTDMQELLISSFSDRELRLILDELFIDDTVDIIEEMPANVVKRILNQSDAQSRKTINEILQYPEDSAGSLMTIEYVTLRKNMTVKEAFETIRRTGVDKETIYTCYVTDDKRYLQGIVSVKTLLLSNYETKISDVMETNIIHIDTHTDKEEVARLFSKYSFLAMPVVDKESRLVGIITVDDALDVIEDEATEDITKLAGMTPADKPYLKTSIWQIWLNRVPWLLVLMVGATFTGMIITKYESTLAISIALTAFIPMLMDTGGNASSQASVTVIRGIALGEIAFKDMGKILWKEIRVSLLLGGTLAVACFIKIMAIDQLFRLPNGYIIAAAVCVTMFLTIVVAKLIGGILPLFAKALKLDPAVVANPFITTIVDALSLIIYCNIAMALLKPLGI